MKILHVLRSPVGGLFRHVMDLAKGQIERGHSVGIIADSTTGTALSERHLNEIAPCLELGLSRVAISRQPDLSDVIALAHLAGRIRSVRPDIVHGHGAKGGALARLAPAWGNPVRAYTPHGGSLHDAVGRRAHILLERMLKPFGQLYLFESEYSRHMFAQKIGGCSAIARVVHNGIRPDDFVPVAPRPDATDLVYLGELRLLKGVDVLIDAIAQLNRSGRRITATLIGDGPDAPLLRGRVAERGLTDVVRFRGALAARDAFAIGHTVVVPSRAESLPYVVLEAIGAGKPVIATRVGGISEIFGDESDRLIAPGNPHALADAIGQVGVGKDKDVWARLRERVAKKFSANTMVDGVLDAYRQAMLAAVSSWRPVRRDFRRDALLPGNHGEHQILTMPIARKGHAADMDQDQ